MNRPTRLCVIRHGETDWNVQKRIQGQLDVPLNEEGRAQARSVGRGLVGMMFDAVYSSDQSRALETARIIAESMCESGNPMAVYTHGGLRERHFGVFQSHTYAESRILFPDLYARHEAREPEFVPPNGGESLVQLAQRVNDCLQLLLDDHQGHTILVVTHGGVLDVIRRLATDRALHLPRDFEIPNAALNWLVARDGRWHMETWADRRHLEQALDELP